MLSSEVLSDTSDPKARCAISTVRPNQQVRATLSPHFFGPSPLRTWWTPEVVARQAFYRHHDLILILRTHRAFSMSEVDRAPSPAYKAVGSSPISVDQELYSNIAATTEREVIESFILPIRSGRAWVVPQGHLCRLSTPEGPEVGDLNIWNLHNPRERFWAARTRQLHRSHVTTFDRLWSCLPYLRPLVTIIADSLSDYGVDQHGGRVHDVSNALYPRPAWRVEQFSRLRSEH